MKLIKSFPAVINLRLCVQRKDTIINPVGFSLKKTPKCHDLGHILVKLVE